MNDPTLITKPPLKRIEQQILEFFIGIGKLESSNPKTTEIFAYLQIYGKLTQNQLKKLTHFASSTISTTLNSLLHSNIIIRDIIPKTHQYIYALKEKEVHFIYQPFVAILDDLESLDTSLITIQNRLNTLVSQLQDIKNSDEPLLSTETQFLLRRINSLRNYIEVQRRTIVGQSTNPFFNENVSAFFAKNELGKFSPELVEIEEEFINLLVSNEKFSANDPMANRISGYFYTRKNLTQKQLQALTSISLSTISRVLTKSLASGFISAYKKKYRKPRMYYLDSPASSLISAILVTDAYIFSWEKKFSEILKEMSGKLSRFSKDKSFVTLREKIKDILLKIKAFRKESKSLEDNFFELQKFHQSTF